MSLSTISILLISGSTRAASSNTAVLRSAHSITPTSITTNMYEGLRNLPAFDPDQDHDPLDPRVAALRAAIGTADAILFCTPEYAGALPGTFKNLLDWTIGGGEIYNKPVAWLNVASVASPTRARDAHESLAKVLGYAGTEIVGPACLAAPMAHGTVTAEGIVADPEVLQVLRQSLLALEEHVRSATSI